MILFQETFPRPRKIAKHFKKIDFIVIFSITNLVKSFNANLLTVEKSVHLVLMDTLVGIPTARVSFDTDQSNL